jgi:hypothetical protein
MAAAVSEADISGRLQAVRMIVENMAAAGPTDEQAEVFASAALDLFEGLCINMSVAANAMALLATRCVTASVPKDIDLG